MHNSITVYTPLVYIQLKSSTPVSVEILRGIYGYLIMNLQSEIFKTVSEAFQAFLIEHGSSQYNSLLISILIGK